MNTLYLCLFLPLLLNAHPVIYLLLCLNSEVIWSLFVMVGGRHKKLLKITDAFPLSKFAIVHLIWKINFIRFLRWRRSYVHFFFLNENYIHSLALLLNMNVRLLRKINFSFSLLEQERIFLGEYIILMMNNISGNMFEVFVGGKETLSTFLGSVLFLWNQ